MGSRLRQNAERIFDVYCEITRPQDKAQEPFVLLRYPPDYDDEEVLKPLPKFAFPCESECNAVDHFTYTQTDLEANLRFGFCRHATGAQTCLCIISWYPWFEDFYRLLNTLAEILNRSDGTQVEALLEQLYTARVPEPGAEVSVSVGADHFTFRRPPADLLPAIPASRNLTEYFTAVDPTNMIAMFASMLFERRILIMSKKLSKVTACIHGSAALIYPMFWQHLYIPIVPPHLIDYCSAPMPYLMGIHTSMYEKARAELGDAVILDADNNTLTTAYDDVGALPSDVISTLKKNLRGQDLMGDRVPRAFLKALVMLIGSYREALRMDDQEGSIKKKIAFDREKFLLTRPEKIRPFLEKILELQTFAQFIEDRLQRLNSGQSMQDQFDLEVNRYMDHVRDRDRYKDWARTQGKKSKERMKKARDRTKEGLQAIKRDIKLRLEDKSDRSPGRRSPGGRSPALPRYRPERPPLPEVRMSVLERQESVKKYHVIDVEDLTEDSEDEALATQDDSSLNYKRVSVDLMGDPEIQNVYKKSYSLEDLAILDSHTGYTDDDELSTSEDTADDVTPDGESNKAFPYNSLEHPVLRRTPAPDRPPRPQSTTEHINKLMHRQTNGLLDNAVASSALLPPARGDVTDSRRPVPTPRAAANKRSAIYSVTSDLLDLTVSTGQVPEPQVPVSPPQPAPVIPAVASAPMIVQNSPAEHAEHAEPDPEEKPRVAVRRTGAFYGDKDRTPSFRSSVSAPAGGRPVPTPRAPVSPAAAGSVTPPPPNSLSQPSRGSATPDARSAFMQSHVTKPASTVDEFDPLLSGRVAIDTPVTSSSADSAAASSTAVAGATEDNLLRDWSLDQFQINTNSGGSAPAVSVTAGRPMSEIFRPTAPSVVQNNTTTGHRSIPLKYPGYQPNNSALYSQSILGSVRPLAPLGGAKAMPPTKPLASLSGPAPFVPQQLSYTGTTASPGDAIQPLATTWNKGSDQSQRVSPQHFLDQSNAVSALAGQTANGSLSRSTHLMGPAPYRPPTGTWQAARAPRPVSMIDPGGPYSSHMSQNDVTTKRQSGPPPVPKKSWETFD